MKQAKKGDSVVVHYTGKLADGTVFDSSRDRQPIQFKVGDGQVIPGVENAVVGMNAGDSKTAKIPSEEAYGPRRDDMVVTLDRSQLPADLDPKVGQRLELTQENDQTVLATITDLSEKNITLDGNHPLAGKELTFELELVQVA
ncbi:MAG TPA: peptidylprolyl isomerase [Nitrospiraceae bacterium]|nr:MAG: peptidylprolyl isomerase [Nitrospirae bacterium GWC1_57_7]OGW43802.1 MAG: peptidylprolyl isomerase [Nitrospirae bacterium GWD2_57_8]HAR45870.1 peptidylprolyl isomerase [Nitrospiraceae bacterium]HAS55448.1 peptidylprolyl isomerase [Nitrospiraceae bacterium]